MEQFGAKEDLVLVIFFPLLMIYPSLEGIQLGWVTSRTVDGFKIKAREVEGPASFATIEVLSGAEVGQVLVVIENLNLVFGTF